MVGDLPAVTAELLALIPEHARPAVQALGDDVTPGEAFATILVADALRGDAASRDAILRRLYPEPRLLDVAVGGPDGGPIAVAAASVSATLGGVSAEDAATLRAIARRALVPPKPDGAPPDEAESSEAGGEPLPSDPVIEIEGPPAPARPRARRQKPSV